MSLLRKIGFVGLLALLIVIAGCSEKEAPQEDHVDGEQPKQVEKTDSVPIVTMTMADGGVVEMELYPNTAPNTVNNFISLVEEGFYDGLIFHRVIPDFMIQGGDPDGTGSGGPGYAIKGEFTSNGFENELSHDPGVVSMARTNDPDTAGSQFFIVTGDATSLDGDYAAFGKVITGMDVVKKIVAVERDKSDKPLEDQVIKSMTVELDGYEAEAPIKE